MRSGASAVPAARPRRGRSAVTPIRPLSLLDTGRAALARGAWREARRAFQASLAERESAEALEGLALAAWWLDRGNDVFRARERAYRLYASRRDRLSAARVAVWLAWDSSAFRGEMAVATGWLQRAERWLAGQPLAPEHAWLAVRRGIFALLDDGDPVAAAKYATRAIRVSERINATDFEMIGRALHGFALVTSGRVREGMRELDEVNAAVLAGELTDPVAIALACCYQVAACERVHESQRAVEWCNRLRAFCTSWGLRPLLAVCRTQYASVCLWQGAWAEAEKELVTATRELAASRPGMTGEGAARLGELRRRQGRADEAAALFDRAGHHPLAQLGRIRLSIDRDEPQTAVDLAERHLRHLPRHNLTERAAALELLVRANAANGTGASARAAAAELGAIADRVATASMRAPARLSAGLVAAASGDLESARRALEDAVDLNEECGAPYETALTRLELGRVLSLAGRVKAAEEEVDAAIAAFSRIAAVPELARARQLRRSLAAPEARGAAGRRRPGEGRSPALSPREVEVVRLIARGLSNGRIAERLDLSDHTVHRHVANILVKLEVPSRSAAVAAAASLGLLREMVPGPAP